MHSLLFCQDNLLRGQQSLIFTGSDFVHPGVSNCFYKYVYTTVQSESTTTGRLRGMWSIAQLLMSPSVHFTCYASRKI